MLSLNGSFHNRSEMRIFFGRRRIQYRVRHLFVGRENLLQTIGINREIKDGEAVTTDIDWNKVDNILQAERKHSLDYLKDIIKGE